MNQTKESILTELMSDKTLSDFQRWSGVQPKDIYIDGIYLVFYYEWVSKAEALYKTRRLLHWYGFDFDEKELHVEHHSHYDKAVEVYIDIDELKFR